LIAWALLAPAASDVVLGCRAAFIARFGTNQDFENLVNAVRRDEFGGGDDRAVIRDRLSTHGEEIDRLMREGLSLDQAARQICREEEALAEIDAPGSAAKCDSNAKTTFGAIAELTDAPAQGG